VILLALLALAVVASLLSGGHLEQIAGVQIKHAYLILLSLGIQVLIFSSWWQSRVGLAPWADILYMASMVLLLVATQLNRRLPGITPLNIGLILNAAVILSNGGHMPASLQALRMAGMVDPHVAFETIHIINSSLINETTSLWFLGDIFAVPRGWPLANVFSVGDVLIALGAAWFVWANARPKAQDSRSLASFPS